MAHWLLTTWQGWPAIGVSVAACGLSYWVIDASYHEARYWYRHFAILREMRDITATMAKRRTLNEIVNPRRKS